jgi:hypothetical protein
MKDLILYPRNGEKAAVIIPEQNGYSVAFIQEDETKTVHLGFGQVLGVKRFATLPYALRHAAKLLEAA